MMTDTGSYTVDDKGGELRENKTVQTEELQSELMRRRTDRFHHHRHVNRSWLHHLHQRIRDIHIRDERGAIDRSRRVHRIGRRRLNTFPPPSRPADRDLLRVRRDLRLQPGHECPYHPRMNLDLAREPRVEGQMHLARHDLHYFHVLRSANLLRRQIKRPFSRLGVTQIEFRMSIGRARLPEKTPRA